jgi:PKD repeat protein
MKTCLTTIIILFVLLFHVKAQTDTLFWFAVPYSTISHDPPLTADLTISATDPDNLTHVTISQPRNPQISDINITIDPAVSMTKNISFSQADILKFSNNLYNTKSNSALLIHSDREITAYYETHRADNNPAIFTLKGKNSLGYNFWTPFQTQWDNNDWDAPNDPAFSQIVIVATDSNTVVTFNFKKPAFGYPLTNTDYSITLQKGQTYMLVPKANAADNNDPSILASDRLVGTHITSNKPISVTIGDDSVVKSTAYDYCGDQLIPTINAQNKTVIGYEYVVMRGQVSDASGGERVYVLSTQPGTNLTITHKNGTITNTTITNAGEQYAFTMPSASNDFWAYIKSDKPIYVLHMAGFGHELGEAILPTIDGCTGSLSVSFTRSKSQDFYLNLMTKADALDSFYISINGSPASHFLNSTLFEQAGTSDWYVLKNANKLFSTGVIPAGAVTQIYNTKNVFHLGYFNGVTTDGGCVYGYFSDYNELEATASVEDQGSVFQVCGIDSIELRAKGGISYHWSPTEYLDDPNAQNPILRPPYGGYSQVFYVDIEQPCKGFQTLQVWVIVPQSPNAFMAVDYNKGCGPLEIKMKDASSGANSYILDKGDGSPLQISATPINLSYIYPNKSNTVIDYHLTYTVSNADGCNDFYTDTIRVYPEIYSSYVLSDIKDTAICDHSEVEFKSTCTGNTDTYQWNFGDGSSDVDTLVNHTYTNISVNDTVFHVSLVARSPFGCTDTSVITDIHVFPYIYSSFTMDSARICSPARLFIDPSVSVGVDTFYWSISDINKSYFDSTLVNLDESPVTFPYVNSAHTVPDTLEVSMYAANRFGCYDTATTKSVLIYPLVHSGFTIDDADICDSTGVLFTNNSTGFNLLYEWDFDNGTSVVDTSSAPFTRYFLNRSGEDTVYHIRLYTSSDYYCRDTSSIPLTVHPYVNADFGMDYSDNCSPLMAELINTSWGGDQFEWHFGDGATYNTLIPETLHHSYANNTDKDTTYYIKLYAANKEGCTDSLQRSIFMYPQVVADFNFSTPVQGCNPLNVAFTNNSKGKNLNYIWSFGDNTFSIDQNPVPKTFINLSDKDTTYYFKLTAINVAGCDSSITKPIQVYSHVTADFSIERIDSCSPFKINVDNYSVGGITDFVWQYTNTDSLVLHNFSNPDIPVYRNKTLLPIKYPVILKTRNIHGCQATKNDSITVYPEMFASFHPDMTMGCQPLTVGFTNNSNIIGGTFFTWDFDDGKYSYLATPGNHIYSNKTDLTVPHDIHLEATTEYGCYDDTLITVSVYPYIFAKFTIDRPEICSDEPFTIDRTSSAGAINHYYWDYQDNGTVDEENSAPSFNHTYPNFGTTTLEPKIRLMVTNNEGCDTSWVDSIMVHPQVRAKFAIDNPLLCHPLPATFINQSEPAVPLTYFWDFGDGSSSVDPSPIHAYKNFSHTDNKGFTINLTATSEFGCDSTISDSLTIYPKPLADFSYPLVVDCPPFPVQFTNQSVGTHLSYFWDFDTGNNSTDENPSETFNNTSPDMLENQVSLIVTTDYNCTDTMVKPVQVYPGVKVNFDASAWDGCSPMQINLDGTATNENEYYWYVDGKVVSNYQDPSYRFSNESTTDRTFNVRFRAVSINGCEDDTVKQVVIFPQPLAEFLPSPQSQNYNTETDITSVVFNNQTNNQSLWNYQWSFGDGTSSAQSAASFTKNYTIWGDIHNDSRIPVSLIATNSSHPICADTILHFIIINPPLPKVDLGPDVSGCMPLTVNFPSTTKYNYADSFQWDFGYEGQSSTDDVPAPLVYDTAGTYIVRLSVAGDGGSNWDYKTVTVYPKPVANYSFAPDSAWVASQTEPGTAIKFFNLSGSGMSYTWDFDDGETSHEFQPQHEYDQIGQYYITLTAKNTYDCLDTFTSEKPVIIYARGILRFPNAIVIVPDNPANEYYDPSDPDPRIFRPYSSGIEKYKLEIYNRWGELIFESKDVNKGWNGFIKGSPVKQDVYVWRVTATFSNGRPVVQAGDVTVLVKQR